MKLSTFQRNTEKEFDYLSKLAIKNERKNYFVQLSRTAEQETSFSELGDPTVKQLGTSDNIPSDYHIFHIKGFPVHIKNDALSKALKELTSRKREILLLYYFVGMNDPEISDLLGLGVSTVNDHRLEALNILKKIMEGRINE